MLISARADASASGYSAEIDAASPGFIALHGFDAPMRGFTDTIPPYGIAQTASTRETEGGYEMELDGVELSVWQTMPLRARDASSLEELAQRTDPRYLLDWHFEYDGEIVEGMGRCGFVFGAREGLALLSVEVTYWGELRVLDWRDRGGQPLGRIAWAKKVAKGGGGPVSIEADYSIRDGILVCRVNGGSPVTIELSRWMTSAPLSMRAAGFFAAVPEAAHISLPISDRDIDIDLSSRHLLARHKRLIVRGSR